MRRLASRSLCRSFSLPPHDLVAMPALSPTMQSVSETHNIFPADLHFVYCACLPPWKLNVARMKHICALCFVPIYHLYFSLLTFPLHFHSFTYTCYMFVHLYIAPSFR